MTEQAYHARGAGREELKSCPKCGGDITREGGHGPWCRDERCKWGWEMDGSALREASNEECRKVINQLASDWHNNLTNVEVYALADKYLRPFLAALREPGADTGTTPQGGGRSPNDTSPMYSDDVIAAIRQQKQSAAAERGTTPPEGLASESTSECNCGWIGHKAALLREFIGYLSVEYRWPQERWENCAKLADDFLNRRESGAATQRAPVEQGRDRRTFEEVIQLHIDSSESMLGVFQRTGDAPGAGMQRGVTAGLKRAIEVYGNWSARQAAPDHAREGALLREAKWWYKEFVWPWRADDEDSDDRARKRLAALADGKEGRE